MRRAPTYPAFFLALVALLCFGTAPARAQAAQQQSEERAQAAPAEQPGEATDQAKAGKETGKGGSKSQDIDELLAGEEQVLAGEGYSYDPGTRRDPFKSLLVTTQLPNFRGPRPEGIPGLLIDEILVTGIFRTDQGYVAQVQSSENAKSYLVKAGDQLYDGDIVRITANEIVFKQIVQDPTALKPFREVVKTLNPEKG